MNISVRRSTEADWKQIQRLNALLFRYEDALKSDDHSRNLDWPFSDYAINYYQEASRGEKNKQGFIAVADDHVIGYLIGDSFSKGWMKENPIAEIDNMFVEEEFRKHGAGSKLVDAFKVWAKEIGAKRLKVSGYSANQPAMEFYKSQGFYPLQTGFEMPFE